VADFITGNSVQSVRVRTPDPVVLVDAIIGAGGTAVSGGDGAILVQGLTPERIGDLAFTSRVPVHELTPDRASLEEAFMELTAGSVEFRAGGTAAGQPDGDRVTAGEVA
jgi:ABC-2 type transport system ATP-binding protein